MMLWEKGIQLIIDEIDFCIKNKCTEEISLGMLAKKFGCSEFHFSRKFREVSAMNFRDYLGCRNPSLKNFYYFARGVKFDNQDYTAKCVFVKNDIEKYIFIHTIIDYENVLRE